jgi:hypothetical protein
MPVRMRRCTIGDQTTTVMRSVRTRAFIYSIVRTIRHYFQMNPNEIVVSPEEPIPLYLYEREKCVKALTKLQTNVSPLAAALAARHLLMEILHITFQLDGKNPDGLPGIGSFLGSSSCHRRLNSMAVIAERSLANTGREGNESLQVDDKGGTNRRVGS